MIISRHNNHVSIDHGCICGKIQGYVRLLYEDEGLTVIVDSVPEMRFNHVPIKDVVSDITIELM